MCHHENINAFEELILCHVYEVREGQTQYFGAADQAAAGTGRYFVRCFDCGLEKWYGKRRPKWLNRILSSPVTEDGAHRANQALQRSPVTVWGITPPERQLQAGLDDFDDIEHDFDDEELDDEEAAL